MASTFGFCMTPFLTISSAPAGCSASGTPSSAGWKMNLTVPGRRSRICVSIRAVASRIAMCVSCPHACITPTSCPSCCAVALLANGRSVSSRTGSPSMSARNPTTGPGRPPLRIATTPVARDAGLGFEAETLQPLDDVFGSRRLPVRQLRILVQVSTPGQEVLLDASGKSVDLGREGRCLRRCARCLRVKRRRRQHEYESSGESDHSHSASHHAAR